MLIPIDNDVDVPLISTKEASAALERFIHSVTDEETVSKLRTHIINSILASPSVANDPTTAYESAMHSFTQMERVELVLQHNNYTYLTADVCDMLGETQKSLTTWSFSDLSIEINTSGVILFEKPKFKAIVEDPKKSDPLHVTGLMWDYQKAEIYRGANIEKTPVFWVTLIVNMPTNNPKIKTVYTNSDNEFAYIVHNDGKLEPLWEHESKNGLVDETIVDYFAATTMLMQQREIIAEPTTYEPTVKHRKRRDPVLVPTGKDGEKVPFRISTVSLSDTVRKAYAANAGSGKKPTKSWWVKGHWRRQPYGPQRSLRKLIYIHPHISGNVNAPLDDCKTITKIVP